MKFCNPGPEDRAALKQLWMRCFGDSGAYVDRYFEHSYAPERVFALKDEQIAAMLISFPVQYIAEDGDERPGFYLYAVCTDPAHRGQGLCRRLMRETEQALKRGGAAFTCLRAADEGLSSMYEGMGYQPAFFNRETVYMAPRHCYERRDEPCSSADKRGLPPHSFVPVPEGRLACGPSDAPVWQTVSPLEYYALRNLALCGAFLDYPPEVLAHQARLGPLFSLNGGEAIGALERYGDAVICKEYLGDEALLPELAAALHAETLTVRTPGDVPFAMAKSLCDAPVPTGYLGLAFD